MQRIQVTSGRYFKYHVCGGRTVQLSRYDGAVYTGPIVWACLGPNVSTDSQVEGLVSSLNNFAERMTAKEFLASIRRTSCCYFDEMWLYPVDPHTGQRTINPNNRRHPDGLIDLFNKLFANEYPSKIEAIYKIDVDKRGFSYERRATTDEIRHYYREHTHSIINAFMRENRLPEVP